jgi:hypothetical protein
MLLVKNKRTLDFKVFGLLRLLHAAASSFS